MSNRNGSGFAKRDGEQWLAVRREQSDSDVDSVVLDPQFYVIRGFQLESVAVRVTAGEKL